MRPMNGRDRSILVSIVTAAVVVTGAGVIVGTSCLGPLRGRIVGETPAGETVTESASHRTSAGGMPIGPATVEITAAEVPTTPANQSVAPPPHPVETAAPAPAPASPVTVTTAAPTGNAQHAPAALVPRQPLVTPMDTADAGHVTPPPAATTGFVEAGAGTATADAAATSPVEQPRRWLTEPPSWGASHMVPNPEAGAGPFNTDGLR